MNGLSSILISLVFFAAGAAIWLAGGILTKATSTLDTRFRIGDALGGLVLLGISSSLPEVAIIFSAARHGHIPIIIGTILGGLAVQTLVVAIFDFAVSKKRPLSYLAGSASMSIETFMTVFLAIMAVAASYIPVEASFYNINPLSIAIVLAWLSGLFFINRLRRNESLNRAPDDAYPGRQHHERRAKMNHPFYGDKKDWQIIGIFLLACAITMAAGVLLESAGSILAARLGIGSGLFAATAIALMSSLPEISTGLESVYIGDNRLAISDIMGGNAFMLTLFFAADIITGVPVLSLAGKQDILFAVLSILMMSVYAVSFVKRSKRCYFRLGPDSIAVIIIYALGMVLLGRLI